MQVQIFNRLYEKEKKNNLESEIRNYKTFYFIYEIDRC